MEENKDTTVVEDTQEETQEGNETKTYTLDEVNKLLQAEADKRVSSALAKQKKNYEKKLSLSKLDGAEREKAETAQTIQELQEQLASFQLEKNKSELKSVLSGRGLSAEFADLISITDDLDESQKKIEKLDKLFKAAVQAEVEKKLSGGSPKGNTLTDGELTEKQVRKMSLAQLSELERTNPEIYKKYFN